MTDENLTLTDEVSVSIVRAKVDDITVDDPDIATLDPGDHSVADDPDADVFPDSDPVPESDDPADK